MIRSLQSLRVAGVALIALALGLGMVSAGLWVSSTSAWQKHLQSASFSGAMLYDSIIAGTQPPVGSDLSMLAERDQTLADAGEFERLSFAPRPPLVTNLSIGLDPTDPLSGQEMKIAILSKDLRYPLSEIAQSEAPSPRQRLGDIVVLLARYCSDAILLAAVGEEAWQRADGPGVWQCPAAPADRRLLAVLTGAFALAGLATIVIKTSDRFISFADTLRGRRRSGGPDTYQEEGPVELRRIVDAVNGYLEIERQQLSERALVLSGVTHDLGTPATRLKLRAALIEDPELRSKFEADIDRMTGIIESVLTYTRAEMNTEAPRRLALASLMESVVADYQDVGKPVEFSRSETVVVEGGQSIFMSRRGRGSLPEESQVIVTARPIALQRAVSNLIDNALKYGRRALVSLETNSAHAYILVEDEGGDVSATDLEKLVAPFHRGSNATSVGGYGMGLTIAAAIAAEHGGSLSFEPGKSGARARLVIAR
ncbi:MAG: ATP-binding protein [Pseudomonadota bacterium]